MVIRFASNKNNDQKVVEEPAVRRGTNSQGRRNGGALRAHFPPDFRKGANGGTGALTYQYNK